MKKSYSYLGVIKDYNLKIFNEDLFKILLRKLEGKGVELILTVIEDKRSNNHNSYYWTAIVLSIKIGIKDAWGDDISRDEVHEMLKEKFCRQDKYDHKGNRYASIPMSTTKLNKEEFSQYCLNCQQFALDFLGVDITDYDPNSSDSIFNGDRVTDNE